MKTTCILFFFFLVCFLFTLMFIQGNFSCKILFRKKKRQTGTQKSFWSESKSSCLVRYHCQSSSAIDIIRLYASHVDLSASLFTRSLQNLWLFMAWKRRNNSNTQIHTYYIVSMVNATNLNWSSTSKLNIT